MNESSFRQSETARRKDSTLTSSFLRRGAFETFWIHRDFGVWHAPFSNEERGVHDLETESR